MMLHEGQLRLVDAGVFTYPAGETVPAHTHDTVQLVYAESGVLRTTTAGGVWVLPPSRALLVPAGLCHEHRAPVDAEMHTLHLKGLPAGERPGLLAITPLARELISVLAVGHVNAADTGAYLQVLADQLRLAHPVDLSVPTPSDPLLCALTDALRADPSDGATLAQWGARLGASGRTIARRFRAETGLTFDQWRRRARMLHALELLSLGHTVHAAAHAVGYTSASAFVHAFHHLTGTTPAAAVRAPPTRPGDRVVFRIEGERAVLAKTADVLELAGTVHVPPAERGTPWDQVRRESRRARAAPRS
jgi:AraC-like DNA-binding protein/quercetin dioxygenase-like cupin family protein